MDDRLILGGGIDEKWLSSEEGVSVEGMPTYYGKISYALNKEGDVLKIRVDGKAVSPPGGFVFMLPQPKKIKKVSLNGEKIKISSVGDVSFYKIPAEMIVSYEN